MLQLKPLHLGKMKSFHSDSCLGAVAPSSCFTSLIRQRGEIQGAADEHSLPPQRSFHKNARGLLRIPVESSWRSQKPLLCKPNSLLNPVTEL